MMDVVSILAGMLLGMFSGLVPGVHSNTIAGMLSNMEFSPQVLAGAIAAAAASHAVFQFIPAIFMFIPDSDTVVSVLPGQRMLMEGRGCWALYVCTVSCVLAVGLAVVMLPVAIATMPAMYGAIGGGMFPLLGLLCLLLLWSEGSLAGFVKALFVFLLSGLLGVIVLGFPLVGDPLLPSFSGMFALAAIVISIRKRNSIPEQRFDREKLGAWIALPVFLGVLMGMLSDLLPGISSPAQIAVFASLLLYFDAPRYLSFIAAVAASHQVFAYAALSSIGKARIGAAVAAEKALGTLGEGTHMWLIGITVFSAAISGALILLFSRRIIEVFSGIDVQRMGALVAAYLLSITFIINGAAGVFVAVVACCIGVLPPLLGVRRTHLMGLILVPSLLSHAGISGIATSFIFG